MGKISVIFLLIFGYLSAFGQQTVSGYINLEDSSNATQQVYLRHLAMEDQSKSRLVASADIREDGFFAFEDTVFTEQDEIYKLLIKTIPSTGEPRTPEIHSRPFIVSSRDSIFFPEDELAFSSYTTSSKADEEWQKLKGRIMKSQSNLALGSEQHRQETRDYTKDSLQILLVKLLSIKTLDEQQLLEKDIRENADYYLDLLEKLQKSNLPPSSYAYLENKIRSAHQNILKRKYYTSLALNGVGILSIGGLLIVVFRMRKRKDIAPNVALSTQEERIKTLILEGKTNKEIAGELFISISTVKTHITNIYNKLNVSTRQELGLKS